MKHKVQGYSNVYKEDAGIINHDDKAYLNAKIRRSKYKEMQSDIQSLKSNIHAIMKHLGI